jgi:hypothetical protein
MTETKQHELPDVDVQQLVPQGSGEVLLTPDTRVLCIHRGRNRTEFGALIVRHPRRGEKPLHGSRQPGVAYDGDYTDTFDSRHYIVAPGYFEVELAAATHFKDRAVVPGSRNPETNFQASFIAIIGVVAPTGTGFRVIKPIDPPEDWEPFTDEECASYEIAFEALDRDGMANPIDRDVQLASTSSVIAGRPDGGKPSRVKSSGKSGGGRTQRGASIEVTNAEILKPIPPSENSTVRQIQADTAKAQSERAKGE